MPKKQIVMIGLQGQRNSSSSLRGEDAPIQGIESQPAPVIRGLNERPMQLRGCVSLSGLEEMAVGLRLLRIGVAAQVIQDRLSPQPPTPLEVAHEKEVDRIEFKFPSTQGSLRMKRPVRNLHVSRVEDSHTMMQSVMGRSQLRSKFAHAGQNFSENGYRSHRRIWIHHESTILGGFGGQQLPNIIVGRRLRIGRGPRDRSSAILGGAYLNVSVNVVGSGHHTVGNRYPAKVLIEGIATGRCARAAGKSQLRRRWRSRESEGGRSLLVSTSFNSRGSAPARVRAFGALPTVFFVTAFASASRLWLW